MKVVHPLLIAAAITTLSLLTSVNAAEVEYGNTETTTLGHALYIAAEGDELKAVATLLLADKQNQLGKESDASRLYMADTLSRLGMKGEASRYYLLVANNQAAKQPLRDLSWLAYAKIRHDQGDHDGALVALQNIKKTLNDTQQGDATIIKAHSLLAAGKTQEAVDIIPSSLKHSSNWALYKRYNLGSLLLGNHNNKYGAAILHSLTEIDVGKSPELAALKDQANLALGYSLLKISKASKARTYLQQVRIGNMMSNMALLGMGWSYSIEQNHEKALVYWLELHNRPLNSTYQYEASLAIPYAFGQAKAFNQSIAYYKQALNRFVGDASAMSAAKAALDAPGFKNLISGGNSGETTWINSWRPDPLAPETLFLPLFMDSPNFQGALQTYRALLKLNSHAAKIGDEIAAHETASGSSAPELRQQHQQLAEQINQAIRSQLTILQQLASNIIDGYQMQLGQYLQQARFGMAQIIEQAAQNRGDRQ